MMAVTLARWIDYYRASVADGARLCPTVKLLEEAPGVAREELVGGRLPRELVTSLRREADKSVGRAAPPGEKRVAVEAAPLDVLVMPWVFAARFEHGQRDSAILARFVPVILRAWVDTEGGLRPHEVAPWIPRDRLQPVAHEQVTVGKLATADDFGSRQAFAPQRWADVVDYARSLVNAVTGSVVEAVVDEDYALLDKGVVWLAEGDTRMVRNILTLCDALRARLGAQGEDGSSTALPALLSHAGHETRERRVPCASGAAMFARSARHWATVSAEHPLAPTQRLALHELLDTPEGGVLAIQGPPGTGKTTLLKNAVAQLWVEAAVKGLPCPIVAASSTNHQAVTNVIDDYAKDAGEPRWLPNVGGLCLYAASEKNEWAKSGKYQLLTPAGAFPQIESEAETWLPKAEECFLAHATKEPGLMLKQQTVEAAREALRARLRDDRAKIAGLFECWKKMVEDLGEPAPEASLFEAMEKHAAKLCQNQQKAADQKNRAESRRALVARCTRMWEERLASEPWWQVLFAWWAPVRTRRDAGRRLALQPFVEGLGAWPEVEVPAVVARMEGLRVESERKCTVATEACVRTGQAARSWQTQVNELRGRVNELWAEASEAQRGSLAETPDKLWHADGRGIEALADVTWRAQAFRTAVHHWEAGYLLELERVTARGHRRGESDVALWERALRRWAMLAPCVASTFSSLPRFFRGPRDGEPLWGVIDLLVADESGQVPPEKAVAAFALARRALVVGDVYQIEPVWGVSAAVDAANAAKFGLIEPARTREEWATPTRRAVSASGGTLMELAQQASVVGQPGGEGGLLLREHRRCVPEIVAFNNVVYGGLLEPKRASVPTERRILPALGYAALPFRAEQRGGGRRNRGEARLIAAWLKQRCGQIEEHYGKKIGALVAVVTPFRAQKWELLRELATHLGTEHGVTAGTVHALQGAERPIVIFSPVYDETHRDGYFFDGGRGRAMTADPKKRFQMLNVALSRAQDSFLVFGCLDAFHPARGDTPASLLGRHLFGEHGHEITDLPWEAGREAQAAATALRGTDAHDQMLRTAIAEARQKLTISSPYLTQPGLDARGVLPQLADAVRKGVNVEVFADGKLTKDRMTFAEAVARLRAAGVEVRISRPDRGVHAKTLAVDGHLLVEGSFNWFSASAEGGPYHRYEASLVYRGENVGSMIEEALASLRARADIRAP